MNRYDTYLCVSKLLFISNVAVPAFIGLGRTWFFLPNVGYPAGLSGMPCRICRIIRLFLYRKTGIRPDTPALPDIRPNPNRDVTSNIQITTKLKYIQCIWQSRGKGGEKLESLKMIRFILSRIQ